MKPVPVEIANDVLSRQIDDLKPTLTRHSCVIREGPDVRRVVGQRAHWLLNKSCGTPAAAKT